MYRVYLSVAVVLLGAWLIGSVLGWKTFGILLGVVVVGFVVLLVLTGSYESNTDAKKAARAEELAARLRDRERAARSAGALLPSETYLGDVPVEFAPDRTPGFFGASETSYILTFSLDQSDCHIERLDSTLLGNISVRSARPDRSGVLMYQWPDEPSYRQARMESSLDTALRSGQQLHVFDVDDRRLSDYHELMRRHEETSEGEHRGEVHYPASDGSLAERIYPLGDYIFALENYYASRYPTMNAMPVAAVDGLAKLHGIYDVMKLIASSDNDEPAGQAESWPKEVEAALAMIPLPDRVGAGVQIF